MKRPVKPAFLLWAALCAALALFAGCVPAASRAARPANEVAYPVAVSYDDYEGQRAVREQNPVSDAIIARVNGFAYRSADALLPDAQGNANYSPLSLYYALALLCEGAEGETRAELAEALTGVPDGTPGEELGNLMRRLYTDDGIGRLEIANALWMREGIPFGAAFCETAAKEYYAALFTLDFDDAAAGRAIAAWVAEQTGGMVEPEVTLSPGQILLLANTVLFEDEWFDVFSEEKTADGTFHAPGGDVTVPFLHALRTGGFARGEGFARASLPLKSAGSMTFVLPDEGTDVAALLEGQGLAGLLETGEEAVAEIEWSLPKFSFDCEYDLAPMLRALGVTRAFQPDAALDGIHPDAYLSAATQQTHIAIDEKGVAAAAFTRLDVAGAADVEPQRVSFTLDRPFLFAITTAQGALLFVGVVASPAA